jgi:maleate cis-trans isomerase
MEVALRVGLMIPMNNTTMERELLAWLPAGSACSTLRIPRGKGTLTLADIPAYVAQATTLAERFADESLDVVVYGCTAAGILAGPARDAAIADSLAEITGRPTVTTASSMVTSLQSAGAREIALVTPYLEHVNERLREFLARSDIRVRNMSSFGAETVEDLGVIGSDAIADRARATMDERCEALFIACSQLPTREIIGPLEAELRRPVWSSIRATAWQARETLGRALAR